MELSSHEQVVVLVVVLCAVTFAALVLVSLWNLVRFAWHYVHEQRALRQLFTEPNVRQLRAAIQRFPTTSSLLLRRLALARLQHLEFLDTATTVNVELSTLSFDEDALELHGLPRRVDDRTKAAELTLVDVLERLAQLQSQGEAVAVELLDVAQTVPVRWQRYVTVPAWLTKHDACLATLQAHASRVQQLIACVSELLMRKLHDGDAVPKRTFVHLLAALRPSGATDDNDSHSHAGSRTGTGNGHSTSRSRLATEPTRKDEFRFVVKAFDELSEQNQVKHELRHAMLRYHSRVTTTATAIKAAIAAPVGPETPIPNDNDTDDPHPQANATDDDKALLTRKLEQCVDKAEVLGVTHFEEVERAQLALEHARRERFCAAIFSKDAKELENVESLALNFVNMGARRHDAVLKAGEILANRSNTMLLVTSLRGMFDELRKHDIVKMNERRRRDAAQQLDKRERMADKFRLKQALVADKLARQRAAQQLQRDDERRERARLEAATWRQLVAAERRQFVGRVTKVDVLVVLLVMGLVFFESVRQLAFLKPVCAPDDTRFSGVLSLFGGGTNALAVLGCQVAYGAKIAAILLVVSLGLFLLAQLNLLMVVLPAAVAFALYHVRTEWLNMLVRTPLFGVAYGFNASCLYVLNRADENDDKEEDVSLSPHRLQDQHDRRDTHNNSRDRRRTTTTGRLLLAYVVFPLLSLALSVVVGVGIACDDPRQCAATAWHTAMPVVRGLAALARDAYGL